MGIVNRVIGLMKADVHGILDTLEEPEAVLKQALRDMEEAVLRRQREIEVVTQKVSELDVRVKALGERERALEEELTLCLEKAELELARAVIRKKLAVKRALAAVSKTLSIHISVQEENQKKLKDEQEKFATMQDRAKLLELGTKSKQESGGVFTFEDSISPDDVEIELLREMKLRAEVQGGKSI